MEWALALRSVGPTSMWRAFTFLGEIGFFLTAVPIAYWLWRKESVLRIAVVLVLSAVLNAHLKHVFAIPRPFMVPDPTVDALIEAQGWSMPSGHAQTAAVFWGACAKELGGRWAYVVAAVLIVMVSLSRVALGVHYPRDVLAGAAVGFAVLGLAYAAAPRLADRLDRLGLAAHVGLAVLGSALWMGLIRITAADGVLPPQAGVALGALIGIWVGARLEQQRLDFQAPRRHRDRAAVILIGLVGIVALRFGLKAILTPLPLPPAVADTVRYAAIGLWIGWGAPWAFIRLGLTGSGYSPRP